MINENNMNPTMIKRSHFEMYLPNTIRPLKSAAFRGTDNIFYIRNKKQKIYG